MIPVKHNVVRRAPGERCRRYFGAVARKERSPYRISEIDPSSVEFASRIPQRIILIDGNRLAELMIEHSVGVRLSRKLEFKRLDEDFFSEE